MHYVYERGPLPPGLPAIIGVSSPVWKSPDNLRGHVCQDLHQPPGKGGAAPGDFLNSGRVRHLSGDWWSQRCPPRKARPVLCGLEHLCPCTRLAVLPFSLTAHPLGPGVPSSASCICFSKPWLERSE